jgi:uncharacterized membrane protein
MTKVSEPLDQEELHVSCPKCATENAAEAAFCRRCGTRLTQSATPTARRPTDPLAVWSLIAGCIGVAWTLFVAVHPLFRETAYLMANPEWLSQTSMWAVAMALVVVIGAGITLARLPATRATRWRPMTTVIVVSGCLLLLVPSFLAVTMRTYQVAPQSYFSTKTLVPVALFFLGGLIVWARTATMILVAGLVLAVSLARMRNPAAPLTGRK